MFQELDEKLTMQKNPLHIKISVFNTFSIYQLQYVCLAVVTSTSFRDYSLTFGAINQTLSYRVHQNITYQECRHLPKHLGIPTTQQLDVDRVFALYSDEERVLRFAVTNQIGPVEGKNFCCCSWAKITSNFSSFLFESPQNDLQKLLRVTECQALCYVLDIRMNKVRSCP